MMQRCKMWQERMRIITVGISFEQTMVLHAWIRHFLSTTMNIYASDITVYRYTFKNLDDQSRANDLCSELARAAERGNNSPVTFNRLKKKTTII